VRERDRVPCDTELKLSSELFKTRIKNVLDWQLKMTIYLGAKLGTFILKNSQNKKRFKKE
jgi:hypothetical protein